MKEIIATENQLPEFTGSLDHWQVDIDNLVNAFKHPEGYAFEAQLPQVIGYIPEEERLALDAWNGITINDEATHFSADAKTTNPIALVEAVLPETIATIRNDIALVTSGRAYLHYFEMEKKFTPACESPRANNIHTDVTIKYETDIIEPTYTISTVYPTIFYKGPTQLEMGGTRLRMVSNSLDEALVQSMIPAPAYAIVRSNGATVHASPVFPEDATRTFMRGSTSLRYFTPPESPTSKLYTLV